MSSFMGWTSYDLQVICMKCGETWNNEMPDDACECTEEDDLEEEEEE